MAKANDKLQRLSPVNSSKVDEVCQLLKLSDKDISEIKLLLEHHGNLTDEEKSAIIYLTACAKKLDVSAKNNSDVVSAELGISDRFFRDKIADLRNIYASSSDFVEKVSVAAQSKINANQSDIVRKLAVAVETEIGKSAQSLQSTLDASLKASGSELRSVVSQVRSSLASQVMSHIRFREVIQAASALVLVLGLSVYGAVAVTHSFDNSRVNDAVKTLGAIPEFQLKAIAFLAQYNNIYDAVAKNCESTSRRVARVNGREACSLPLWIEADSGVPSHGTLFNFGFFGLLEAVGFWLDSCGGWAAFGIGSVIFYFVGIWVGRFNPKD